jgi:hypothetical protein
MPSRGRRSCSEDTAVHVVGCFTEETVPDIKEASVVRYESPSKQSLEPVARYELSSDDAARIRSLAERMTPENPGILTEGRLRRLALASHQLPRSVLAALVDFRLTGRPSGGFIISGLAISDDALGPTPLSMRGVAPTLEAARADSAMLLLASILGDPFSYASVQDGSLVVDVLPVPGNEDTQLGSSSSAALAWHNEEAFHDFRCDWLLLMCLRNDQQVATTFARIDDVELGRDVFDVLFEQRYVITRYSPDDGDPVDGTAKKIAVLSGDPRSPFLRIDPAFMDRRMPNPLAELALATVIDGLDASLQDVVLRPGDVLVIDNLRAVHGRRPFAARYDGSDRWLRIVNVTADLRKSEGLRSGPHGRVLATGDASRPQFAAREAGFSGR